MSLELQLLAALLLLAIVQVLLAAGARTAELGLKWNAGPRDAPVPPPGPLAGRLMRAQANLFETLPLFAAAVLIAEAAGQTGPLTEAGAWLYAGARFIYLPLYAFGVPYLRSLVWAAGLAGLLLVILALFA